MLDESGPEILNGNVKQLTITYSDDDFPEGDHSVVDFDERGNVIKKRMESRGNKFQITYTTKYAITGKKLETMGDIKNLTKYPVGFLRQDTTTMDTTTKLAGVYEYNRDGLITKYILNPHDPSSDSYLYKYNSDGRIAESDYNINPKQLLNILKYKYDDKHHLVEVDQFTNKNFLVSKILYHYKTFDKKNNWLICLLSSKNIYENWRVKADTITRKITYY